MSVTGRNTSRVSDRFGDKVERLEEAQECGHGWSPGVPGWNPWVSVKKLDPPRQGRRKLGIAALLRPFGADTMGTPVIHGFRPHRADFTCATFLNPFGVPYFVTGTVTDPHVWACVL
jgi:hypothetical protein